MDAWFNKQKPYQWTRQGVQFGIIHWIDGMADAPTKAKKKDDRWIDELKN